MGHRLFKKISANKKQLLKLSSPNKKLKPCQVEGVKAKSEGTSAATGPDGTVPSHPERRLIMALRNDW